MGCALPCIASPWPHLPTPPLPLSHFAITGAPCQQLDRQSDMTVHCIYGVHTSCTPPAMLLLYVCAGSPPSLLGGIIRDAALQGFLHALRLRLV